jgi:hypothetical protein
MDGAYANYDSNGICLGIQGAGAEKASGLFHG